MPAFVAVRENQPHFTDLYERVYERTRVKMKGFVAVQKKLLVMMYHLWKRNEMYDPTYAFNGVAPDYAEATHDEPHKEALI